MDGNPATGAATVREAISRARALARDLYRRDVRELAQGWGMSTTVLGAVPELGVDADEPYRAFLTPDLGDRGCRARDPSDRAVELQDHGHVLLGVVEEAALAYGACTLVVAGEREPGVAAELVEVHFRYRTPACTLPS